MSAELTIAIPFFADSDYLRTAIESVLAQDRDSWCLRVVDDGAPEEGAADVVRGFDDPRIVYLRNDPHLGMVKNWNRCLDLAETDLVTLLHGDDRLLPGYVSTLVDLARGHPEAAALFCAAEVIDGGGRPVFSLADRVKRFFVPAGAGPIVLRGSAALRALMAGNFIICPTLCFRRSVLRDRRFSDRWKQVQDLELTARLLMDGETLIGSRSVAYAYRRHRASTTERQSESLLRFEEEFDLFDLVAARAEQLGWQPAARVARAKLIVRLHLAYRMLRDLVRLRPSQAGRKLRFLRGGP